MGSLVGSELRPIRWSRLLTKTPPEILVDRKRQRDKAYRSGFSQEKKDVINAHRRRVYAENPDIKLKVAAAEKNRQRVLRLRIIEAYGGQCVRCGFDDWRALQIDHVYGGGRRSESKSITSYDYKVLREVASGNYQLLCANCNWIKRYEQGEHN